LDFSHYSVYNIWGVPFIHYGEELPVQSGETPDWWLFKVKGAIRKILWSNNSIYLKWNSKTSILDLNIFIDVTW